MSRSQSTRSCGKDGEATQSSVSQANTFENCDAYDSSTVNARKATRMIDDDKMAMNPSAGKQTKHWHTETIVAGAEGAQPAAQLQVFSSMELV